MGADQEHYFVPPYVGARGWVGAYLDVPDVDWDRIELLAGRLPLRHHAVIASISFSRPEIPVGITLRGKPIRFAAVCAARASSGSSGS